MKVAVCGSISLGGVKMRGRAMAAALGWQFRDVARDRYEKTDVTILVKSPLAARREALRATCDRLIWDPLDCWSQKNIPPLEFWRRAIDELQPDDVLLTTPSAIDCVLLALAGHPRPPRLHLVPHQCDARVEDVESNPAGWVVYAGAMQYAKFGVAAMRAACELIGRRMVFSSGDEAWRGLHGASLVLAPRLPPSAFPLNRLCKPQVKLENAAALGLAVLATDCPCVTSLRPEVTTLPVEAWRDPVALAAAMRRALAAPGLKNPVRPEAAYEFVRALAHEEI